MPKYFAQQIVTHFFKQFITVYVDDKLGLLFKGPTIPSDIKNFSDFEEFLNKIKKNVLKRFILNCD